MKFLKLAKIGFFIFFINVIHTDNLRSEINTNLIVKRFCKEAVKLEFKKNNIEYEESIGDEVCNCYLKNIAKNLSHKESISKCKLEKLEKFEEN